MRKRGRGLESQPLAGACPGAAGAASLPAGIDGLELRTWRAATAREGGRYTAMAPRREGGWKGGCCLSRFLVVVPGRGARWPRGPAVDCVSAVVLSAAVVSPFPPPPRAACAAGAGAVVPPPLPPSAGGAVGAGAGGGDGPSPPLSSASAPRAVQDAQGGKQHARKLPTPQT